ncbi:hypothetical protein, partial [Algoriphagus sp.]|uniref:hypothetical protein n=1 Tax=Algoriphagus sp. TaxID=1872435 RepID=UPI00272FB468
NKGAFLKLGSLSGFIVNGLKPYKLWQSAGLSNYSLCKSFLNVLKPNKQSKFQMKIFDLFFLILCSILHGIYRSYPKFLLT